MVVGGAGATPVVEGFTDLVEIGSGGFSVVYAATQTALRRRVALKVLSATGGELRRVEREAAALGALSDIPNVVQIFQVTSTSDGRPVLVTALMESSIPVGIGLDGDGPERALVWLTQVATALDEAHRRGIFHRDIKPQNVLLSADGSAYLVDFGIAGLDGLESGTTTSFSFSPPFAPPERLEGAETDLRAGDIYALAATFFAVLSGSPPFGSAETGGVHGLISRVVTAPLPRPDGMGEALHRAFATAMAKQPTDRFRTATEFAAAVHDALRPASALSGPAGPPTTPVAPVAPVQAVAPSDTAGPARDRVTSINRRGVVVAAVTLLALGLIAAFAFAQRGGSDSDEETAAPSTPTSTTAEVTTTSAPAVTLSTCTLTGSAALNPGVPFGIVSEQTVTLPADVTCSSDQGELVGRTDFTVSFPELGFNGGTGDGSGTIEWADGRTTPVEITADVTPEPFSLTLWLEAADGPGAGQDGVSVSSLAVDILEGDVLTSILVQGDVTWNPASGVQGTIPGTAPDGGLVLD